MANHKVNTNHRSFSRVWYNRQGTFPLAASVKLPTSGPHGMISAPHTDVMNRSHSEVYTSRVFELKEKAGYVKATLTMELPPGNEVRLSLRSAPSQEQLSGAVWKNIKCQEPIPLQEFAGCVFQYRLELIANDGIGTPRISAVTFVFK